MRKLIIMLVFVLVSSLVIGVDKWLLVGGERYLNISNVVQFSIEVYSLSGESYGVYLTYSLDGNSPSISKINEESVGAIMLFYFKEQFPSDPKSTFPPTEKSTSSPQSQEDLAKEAARIFRKVLYDFIIDSDAILLEVIDQGNAFTVSVDGISLILD